MATKKAFEISEVNVKEVSLVDNPAVPKAKIRLIKSLCQGDLFQSLVGDFPISVSKLLEAMKDHWQDLEDDIQAEAISVSTEMAKAEKSVSRFDSVVSKGFLEDNWNSDTDYLLGDINYITGMLQSVMSYFRWVNTNLKSEETKGKLDGIAEKVLPALIESSALFTMTANEMCPGAMPSGMDAMVGQLEEAVVKISGKKEDSAVAAAPVEEVPSWAKELVSAIVELKAQVALLSANAPKVESEESSTPIEDTTPVEDVAVFSLEEIEAIFNGGLDGMSDDEKVAVISAVEAQIAAAEVAV